MVRYQAVPMFTGVMVIGRDSIRVFRGIDNAWYARCGSCGEYKLDQESQDKINSSETPADFYLLFCPRCEV